MVGKVLNPIGFEYITTPTPSCPSRSRRTRTAVIPDIALEPSRTQHLRVTDAEGRRLEETWVYCLQGGSS